MSQHAVGGLVVALMALLVAVGVFFQAATTRRRRAEISHTYVSSGGMAYTVIQFGCGGVLALFALGLLLIVLLNPRS